MLCNSCQDGEHSGSTNAKEGRREGSKEGRKGGRKERKREGRARHQSRPLYEHKVPVFVLSMEEKSLPWKVRNRKFSFCLKRNSINQQKLHYTKDRCYLLCIYPMNKN